MNASNVERASWAAAALMAWRAAKGENMPDEADARDLVTDLLHLISVQG